MKTIRMFTAVTMLTLLMAGCSQKEGNQTFVDYETIDKNDAFRAGIKTGNFIRLSKGYVYYEFENKTADTLLVLVHGFSVPSYVWDSTFYSAIRRGYGVLRYDNFGRGYSENPDVPYDVNLYANQLKEIMDSLHINKKVNLAGLSDGGRTITAFASQFPDRIQNLVYVDPAGFDNPTPSANANVVTDQEIESFKRSRYSTMAQGQMSDFYDSIPFRGWDKKYKELMSYKGFVRALISTNKNRTNLEREHKAIGASGIQVFAIWGREDTVVKLEEVRPTLMQRLPAVKLFVIEKAGHLPQMEKTAEFNSILFDQIISPAK